MKNRTTIWLFVILVFILPVLGFTIMNWYTNSVQPLPVLGPVITDISGNKTLHTISDFVMTNQDGQNVSTADWKNKIVVVDFFFTHCPIVCPKLTNSIQRVQQNFKSDNGLLFNSFSVDPERDSISVLKEYTMRFELNTHNWHLLTGDKKEIYKLARNSFMVAATDGDGGPEDFIHSEKLVLIDKQKRIRGYYNGTDVTEINQLMEDIKKLKNEK